MNVPRRCAEFLAAVTLASVGLGGGASSAPPVEAAAGFALDLYRPGDFVAQTTPYKCIGASMQMMINMMAPANDRSAATQHRLWLLARTFRSPDRPPNLPRRGASVHGWSLGLNRLGYGPYRVVGLSRLDEAAATAADAIHATGRPAGLIVHAGRHAWVMSGFRATADPLSGHAFRVTHVDVVDPWYPFGNSRWGASPAPGASISVADLGKQFVPRRRASWARPGSLSSRLAGKYVVLIPVELELPTPTATRAAAH